MERPEFFSFKSIRSCMLRHFILLIASTTIAACSNSNRTEEIINNKTDSTSQFSQRDSSEEESSDSVKVVTKALSKSSLTCNDFEKLDYWQSELNSNRILLNKGFEFLGDSSFSETKKYMYRKSGTGDIIEILLSKSSTGAQSFVISYSLSSLSLYEAFIESLENANYIFKKGENRFEKFISSYEELYIYSNSQISKDGRLDYSIKYVHWQGKELSTPELDKKEPE